MDLSRISAALADVPEGADLPVDRWHPEHCGDIDILIRADGTWIHEGAAIERAPLVRLFSRVLRKDADGYVLVTPAEKLRLQVEDVPFIVSDVDRDGDALVVRTNVGDMVRIGADHPLETRQPQGEDTQVPYVRVRGDLWARFGRAAYYRLIDEESWERNGRLGVSSAGQEFDLGALT